MAWTFAQSAAGYRNLWSRMTIKSNWVGNADYVAKQILKNRERYKAIEAETGVPWFMVGAIHSLECGLRFDRHLHNGDSLKRRTYRVPAGRPRSGSPPFTFEESAIDALTMAPHSLHKVREWPIERIAYELERYNGWGYTGKGVNSPYLWSGSNLYSRGKYVADGKWSSSAVSQQTGALVIIKRLAEVDAEVATRIAGGPVPVQLPQPGEPPKPVPELPEDGAEDDPVPVPAPKTGGKSSTIWNSIGGIFIAAGTAIANALSDWRVLSVVGGIILVLIFLYIMRERWMKPDIIKRVS